ncbi:ABC-type phosphate transport system, permease component [Desulfosporosinus orientis DSM 765]|uniref:ABC-type phosphate transport system, permease component n=1 Tax=Desulfosporosinus orientis (strain ATCC 19365 / DSM 765 / NCIMB 8382 / VKM B-1628 / Singapore I) TaxID=768706 RepID=G7W673_DESOD|nr:ABC transporter permease subunit [Desulfosporosinus orientis]AET67735.1 ABC-type phosphate transport system, permease component [Desulfosporosinus orientis DSM 765]
MRARNVMLRFWSVLSTVLSLGLLVFLLAFVFIKAQGVITPNFILTKPAGFPVGSAGGIWPAIAGSLLVTLIAGLSAGILAFFAAVYMVFYCKSLRILLILNLIIQCIAGIPSIVLGLFGYAFLVIKLKLGLSLLASGLTLAIMIFPFIQIRLQKLFQETGKQLLEASASLGVSQAYTIFNLLLPLYRKQILAIVTLASGFAMGAAAPVMLTGCMMNAPVPKSITSPFMSLPYHLYVLIGQGISLEYAYGTAFILMVLVLGLNLLAALPAILRIRGRS